jgi:hypothetical protein
MGWLMDIRRSLTKRGRLKRISKILGRVEDFEQFVGHVHWQEDGYERAIQNLLDLCETDKVLGQILRDYGVDRGSLWDLYTQLAANGAGQWVRGHYVAASALASEQTLTYCLEERRKGTPIRHIAFELVECFHRGDIKMKGR